MTRKAATLLSTALGTSLLLCTSHNVYAQWVHIHGGQHSRCLAHDIGVGGKQFAVECIEAVG